MAETLLIAPIIIGFIFILCVSVYTLISILIHHQKYGVKLTVILNFLAIFNAVMIYSTIYFISVIFFFAEGTNILLWKFSLISGFIGLILISLIYAFLKEFKKVPYFPFLYFMILFGLLIGSFFMPNSVQVSIISDISIINYTFNFMTGLIISIFQSSFVIYFFFLCYNIYKKARDKAALKGLIIISFILAFPILMYVFYIATQVWVFRELHIFSLWINITSMCFIIVKKPEIFSELTNKIYYINIYHKSGILLFSYKFKTSNNEVDSTIWGNILIGINHILSEFVDTKDQIEVLQTENSDIIVNYDNFGFAVVLITNRKNDILKKLMDNFSKEFRVKYKNELIEIQDLNKLINVSEFKETKDIIEKNFQIYL